MTEFGDEKGLSLLEVMVAMFMVALISSSLMGGFITSDIILQQAEQETRASSYAYAILEDLRARPVEDWTEIVADPIKAYGHLGKGQIGSSTGDMQACISMSKRTDYPVLYDVQVRVTWEDGEESRALEMVTLFNSQLRGEVP